MNSRRLPSQHKRIRWAIAILAIGATGCPTDDSKRVAETAAVATKPVVVKTVRVQQGSQRRTSLQPATVHALFESKIRTMVTGYVEDIRVDIGDVVQPGDTLIKISVPEKIKQRDVMAAQVDRKRAEQMRVTAGITLAEAKVEAAEANLEEARSQLQSVEASLAAAQAEYDRTQDLVERGSLQRRVLDEVTQKRDSQVAAKNAVQSSIQSAQAAVTVSKAERLAAEADLEAAKLETEIAQRQLEQLGVLIDYATIKAPIGGVITMRNVEPGNRVSEREESETPLLVVSQLDRVRIHIAVPEADAAWVNPGDQVSITFPSFSDEKPLSATVTRQANSLDIGTRTMLVEVEVANPDGKYLPGMFGQATIELEAETNVAQLPSRAIRFREDGRSFVYVVRDDNTVAVTPIEIGADDGNRIEVVSGLPLGTSVIDTHLQRFTDGQTVEILAPQS